MNNNGITIANLAGNTIGGGGLYAPPKPPVYTYGADPEFMLFDLEQNKIVSAIGVLNNDKHTPIDLGDGIMMYADNVLVEFSFPPATSHHAFVQMLQKVLRLGQATLGKRYRLIAKAAHIYDEAELAHPKAKEGGCSPNFDVYAKTANLPPKFEGGLRTGSFHLHVGSEWLREKENKDRTIMMLDCYLGLASVVFDRDPTAIHRRTLYGKAGEFRPTEYGIEYRVLGPYALKSPDLVLTCLSLAELALQNAYAIRNDTDWLPPFRKESVIPIINTCAAEDATNLLCRIMNRPMLNEIIKPRTPDLYRDWSITP